MTHTDFFLIMAAIYLAHDVTPRVRHLAVIGFTLAAAVSVLAQLSRHL